MKGKKEHQQVFQLLNNGFSQWQNGIPVKQLPKKGSGEGSSNLQIDKKV